MWCTTCQHYPQLGHSVPFVPGTSNFMLGSLKYYQRSGSHAVSLALWQSGGWVTSVIQTLPSDVLQGILALFRIVYRIAHRSGPLSHLEGDAENVSLNGGTIIPSYRSGQPPDSHSRRAMGAFSEAGVCKPSSSNPRNGGAFTCYPLAF